MSPSPSDAVFVLGAGAIGCYLGGCLQAAGARVHYIGRPRVLAALRTHGLRLSDLDGRDQTLPAAQLRLHAGLDEALAALRADAPFSAPGEAPQPGLVLLCVKSGATAAAAAEAAAQLPAGTPLLSFQNGVDPVGIARQAAPGLRVLAGMVPFNVAQQAPGHWHRGTAGELAVQDDAVLADWLPRFAAAGLPLQRHADLRPVQWGKLLLNLNNPVNALSGLTLQAQLLDRGYRRVLAALQDEALAALRATGLAPARLTPLPPSWLPTLLRLPTPVFRRVAARMLRIEARARSSMADDLDAGRATEIDALCGAVVRLAAAQGLAAPRNARMVALIEAVGPGGRAPLPQGSAAAPVPGVPMPAAQLARALGLVGAG